MTSWLKDQDRNGDGKIDADELNKAQSLQSAIDGLDMDGDGAVSAKEVTARIEAWQETRVGLAQVRCEVIYKGRPLVGATVTFEPEEFLGGNVKACAGKTTKQGNTMLSIQGAPDNLPGAAPGFYRIKITSPHVEIPAEYNAQTTLGREIAIDAGSVRAGVFLDLK